MPKKTLTDSGKKEDILSAALELFLENGYEKTSVRMISQKIGCEAGLIYYYFKTKDDVFENALALYYKQTEAELQKLTDTQTNIEDIIAYLEEKASKFREDFAGMHFSVRTAVCEKIASITETHLKNTLEKTDKKDVAVIASFTASGLCRLIFSENTDFYKANKETILQTAKKLISDEKETGGKKREIPSFLL